MQLVVLCVAHEDVLLADTTWLAPTNESEMPAHRAIMLLDANYTLADNCG